MLKNDLLGKKFRVSAHARQQWEARAAAGEDIVASFKRALPFGAQYGNCVLLLDGEIVFCTSAERGERAITTVLTREQAVVNMQTSVYGMGCPRVYPDKPAVQQTWKAPPIADEPTAEPENIASEVVASSGPRIVGSVVLPPMIPMPNIDGLTHDNRERLKKLTDEELDGMLKSCNNVLRDYSSRVTKDQRKKIGSAIFHVQLEVQLRRSKRHAALMELQFRALKQAARQMLGEEKAVELFTLATSLQEELEPCNLGSSAAESLAEPASEDSSNTQT